eukprot:1161628-Pelagomonas_calceolata.AAC.1
MCLRACSQDGKSLGHTCATSKPSTQAAAYCCCAWVRCLCPAVTWPLPLCAWEAGLQGWRTFFEAVPCIVFKKLQMHAPLVLCLPKWLDATSSLASQKAAAAAAAALLMVVVVPVLVVQRVGYIT